MIGLLPILARWRLGLSLAAALALIGLIGALSHYRSAYHAERALRASDRAAYGSAQAEAQRRASDAVRATEARYVIQAKDADHDHETDLADARSAADAFIARNRVRGQAARCHASGAVASAEDRSPRIPDQVPADSVLVPASDVQACTGAVSYGIAAHDWAARLND